MHVTGRTEVRPIPHTAWESLIEGLDSLDCILLDEESHNPMTENPVHFDSVLIAWLNEGR